MASKTYTAQEMREYADAIADDLNGNGMASVTYTFDELLPVIQSLRYAADVVERCENESEVADNESHDEYTLPSDAVSAIGDKIEEIADAIREEGDAR